ncbi:MAG: leucine-rich repeat domain-containing protein [Clostridia bacterium]
MNKTSARLRKFLLITVTVLLMSGVAVTFAQFFHQNEITAEDGSGTGEVNIVFENVTIDSSDFEKKGDTYTYNFDVKNNGSAAFFYSIVFSIKLDSEENPPNLAKATLLYLDGKFLGTLADAVGSEGTLNVPMPHPLYSGENISHEIKLEYHIGANGYFADSDFELTVSASAKQLVPTSDKYLFASSLYDLEQILANYNYEGYTLRLTGEIELDKNITISKPVTLDLGGHTLNLNDKQFIFAYSDSLPSAILNSRSSGGISGGTVQVSLPNSYLLDHTKSATLTINSASEQAVKDAYAVYLDEVIKGGLREGDDLKGLFGIYIDHFAVAISDDLGLIDQSTLAITAADYTAFTRLTISFPSFIPLEYDVKVWGGDPVAAANTIIENNFFFLPEEYKIDSGTSIPISGDIFLPTISRNSESPITWISSNRDVLTEEGKYTAPYEDVEFELSVVISVNGINILKTFKLTAIAKTPEEKMREISIMHDILVFTQSGEVRELFQAAEFEHMGLTALTYTLPPTIEGIFELDLDNATLKLLESTDIENTYLTVIGTFDEIQVSSTVSIRINILSNISFHDAAYRSIMTYLSAISENTLEGFALPDDYKTDTTIEYIIRPGEVGPYFNPDDVQDFVKVREDGGLDIVVEKLPREDTIVTVEAKITYDEIEEIRYFRFSVSGVIHYADDDIADINLYQELRRKYDINNDWIITAQEAANPIGDNAGVLVASSHNISSLKGIEYFTTLTDADLSNNNITDLSPLSSLVGLEKLVLSNNLIVDTDPLKALNALNYIDLSNNLITNINSLKNKDTITDLILNNNNFLGDLTAIAYMPSLERADITSTLATSSELVKNINVIVTADQNSGGTIAFTGQVININNHRATNLIVNTITPIYEFHNVIYLPPTVIYNGVSYDVAWGVSHPDIVKFEGSRAYIERPVADVNVQLSAQIVNGTITITRYFDVLSVGDDTLPSMIYDGVQMRPSSELIPDERLRYYLIDKFDTDGNKNLDATEMQTHQGDIDLSGKGIKDLTGLEYFKDIITVLDLRNNDFTDVAELGKMTGLTTLRIDGQVDNFDALLAINNSLSLLQIFGVQDINTDANLATLYQIYLNNPGLTIYKDSLDAIWDAYIEPLATALKKLEGIYLLFAGDTQDKMQKLATGVTAVMYNGDIVPLDVTYARLSGQYGIVSIDNEPWIRLRYNAMPAQDEYGRLNATVSIGSTSVTRELTVISVYDTEMHLEMLDEGGQTYFQLLHEVVPNSAARRLILGRLNNTSGPSATIYQGNEIRYISRTSYLGLSSISFTGEGIYGVKGLEIFKGSTTLTTITLTGYMTKPNYTEGSISDTIFTNSGYLSLDVLNSADYPSLRTITINNSVVDLFELKEVTDFTTLTVNNARKVVMDRTPDGEERESVFTHLTALTSVTITNSQVRDFWAVQELKNVIYLRLHGNALANMTLTDYYVGEAYENVFGREIDYRILDANTPWTPKSLDISDLGVTFVQDGTAVMPYPYAVTYLNLQQAGSSITINFPTRYNSSVDNIEWVATAGQSTYTVNGTVFTFSAPTTVTTLTRLTGKLYVAGSNPRSYIGGAEVEYVFVSLKTAGTTGFTAGVLDINHAFMENDRFLDHRFALYMLGLATESGTTGTFTESSVKGITIINNHAPNAATVTTTFYNIKGIRYFTGLETINLGFHTVTDISEIYYLTSLVNLRMYQNRIDNLWATIGGETRSIFYNTPNLAVVDLYNNSLIQDYLPIAYKTESTPRDAAHLINLNTISIYQGEIAYFPAVLVNDDPENIIKMAKAWWNERKDRTIAPQPNLILINNHSNLNNYARVNEFFGVIEALETITTPSEVSVDTALTSSINANGNDYSLTWVTHGSDNNITFSGAGVVSSISPEISHSNHTITVRVETSISGVNSPISRLIDLNIYVQGNRDDYDLWVEITPFELNTAYKDYESDALPYKNLGNQADNHILPAHLIIPDATFRNFMFYNYDTNNNNILDIVTANNERNRTGTVSLTNRFITDLRGMELFKRVTIWNIDYTSFTSLPKMYISKDSLIYRLRLRYAYNLSDLSNLHYDADGEEGTDYVSLADKLTHLDLYTSLSFSDEQYTHIANMPKLTYLDIRSLRIANFDVFHPLYKTINYFNVSNHTVNANDNRTQYKRIVLDSQNGLTLANFSYDNYILRDIIRLDAYPADGVARELPSTFKLPGYDKEYGIRWTAITGNNYTISPNGDKYYITVSPNADMTVPITAQASYVEDGTTHYTWAENLDIITLKEGDASNLYYRMEGTIEIDGEYKNIEDYVPDPLIRYILYANFDANEDGHLSVAELTATTSLSINLSAIRISSIEGIQYLSALESLTLNYIYTDDLSAFAHMDNLQTLTINSLYMLIRDTSVFKEMESLNTLTVGSLGLHNYNFLMENPSITRINTISGTTSGGKTALYSRNSYAYARMYNRFSDIGSQMGNDSYISTQDEKYASTILNAIEIDLEAGSLTQLVNETNTITLPETVTYQGKTYDITWVRMSDKLTISGNELTITQDAFEKDFSLVARISYFQGDIEEGKTLESYSYGCYERLFQVRYQGD